MRLRTLLCCLPLLAGPASAVDLETLVMPGPLAQAHADVEADCRQCHRSFDASAQKALCLECHDEVALDVERRLGFHGRAAGPGVSCRACHPDHRGRDADIVGLAPETFDHRETDFALEGAHLAASCASCHAVGEPHRAAPSRCVACHEADDPHAGRLGDDCGECHDEVAWGSGRFDHDTTRFRLTGSHVDADCALCHPSARYDEAPTDCAACHLTQDVHLGRLGESCADCHGTKAWAEGTFDHARETGFALDGAHGQAACRDCHHGPSKGPDKVTLDSTCRSCHAADDVHDSAFGSDCKRCHSTRSFAKSLFDHDRVTGYALSGAHGRLDCTGCHRGVLGKETLSTRCADCHSESDVHAGQLGSDCQTCHAEHSWTADVLFEHDMTRFPLLGLHVAVDCQDCHVGHRFRDASTECSACHGANDPHRGSLGDDCARCHNPNDWRLWRFDHGRSTRFPLRGRHEGLDCGACHGSSGTKKARPNERCESCHALDDPHQGRFGSRCQSCHDENGWRAVHMMR